VHSSQHDIKTAFLFFGIMSFIFCILLIVRPSHNFVVCPCAVAGHWRLIRLWVGWFRVVSMRGNQLVHELDQATHPYMVPHLWMELYLCFPKCLHEMDKDSFMFTIPVLAAWSCYILGVTCDWRHMIQHMVLLVTEGIWLNTWCYLWLKAYGSTHGVTCDWRHMAEHMALLVTEGIWLNTWRYLWLKAYGSTHDVTCDWRHMAQHMAFLVTEGMWLNTWHYLWLKAYGSTHGITCDWRHMAQHIMGLTFSLVLYNIYNIIIYIYINKSYRWEYEYVNCIFVVQYMVRW